MEFHEKLQELRKARGLTQEELSEKLYVSRAAVSKWESGRGYPNIDSLKAIARFFSVSIDELLSCGEVLTIAEEDRKRASRQFRELVFRLLDLSFFLYLFLPLFGQQEDTAVRAVSLLGLTGVSSWLKIIFLAFVLGMTVLGILPPIPENNSRSGGFRLSLTLHIAGTLLFILTANPYAAAFCFLFLGIKVFILIKTQ